VLYSSPKKEEVEENSSPLKELIKNEEDSSMDSPIKKAPKRRSRIQLVSSSEDEGENDSPKAIKKGKSRKRHQNSLD